MASTSMAGAPLQVSSVLHVLPACLPAAVSISLTGLPLPLPLLLLPLRMQSPHEQPLQSGKFYYKDGSTYEGQYKILGLASPAAEAAPAKKGPKKKDDEAPAQPAEPPRPVRHGAGVATSRHNPARQRIWVHPCWQHLTTACAFHLPCAGTLVCGSYSYTGDWVDDEMHGQGKFSFASGASYLGCFEHNKFQGEGTYTFPDGKQFTVW